MNITDKETEEFKEKAMVNTQADGHFF